MSAELVAETAQRLRGMADTAMDAWPDMSWEGNGSGPLILRQGRFEGLHLEPGHALDLRTRLVLPERIHGVPVSGEPLELFCHAIYPLEIRWNGTSPTVNVSDQVAPGPSLVKVVPELRPGDNGELQLRVDVPDQQTSPWVRLRFVTPGLRRRHEALDVAWARLELARALAASPQEQELVGRAAATVREDLADLDPSLLEETLSPLGEILEPLAERVRRLRVHVIGHSHIDMNWLWTWDDTLRVIRRDLRTVVRLLDEYPELRFTHSQAATYDEVRRLDPDVFEAIQRHVREGRWEVACMQWIESDLNLPSGEALAQQFREGISFAREHLGVSPTTFMAPDTFGHSANVPQLVTRAGGRRYYHHRCNPGGRDFWPAYWWEGEDGTRLLTMGTDTYNGEITAGRIAGAALHALRHGLPTALYFHGIGDHGGGPTRQGLEALRRFARLSGLPEAFCSTLQDYGDEVLRSGVSLPVHRGELNYVFEGCYTSQVETKRRNREGENELVTAGTLDALAGLDSGPQLGPAWRDVLFNQFHDILCGSSIHEVYSRSDADLDRALETARSIKERAAGALAAEVPAGEVAVVNPLAFELEEPVVLAGHDPAAEMSLEGPDGASIPTQRTSEGLLFVARTRPFATERYRLRPGRGEPSQGGLTVEEDEHWITITTGTLSARIQRESGAIVSLLDRRVGRELSPTAYLHPAGGLQTARTDLALGVLQLVQERYHGGSAWHMDGVTAETSLVSGATTAVVEDGPVRAVVETTHCVRRSRIVQRMAFYAALSRVDFETTVDWQEPAGPEHGFTDLKVAFALDLDQNEAWFEVPWGAVRRPASGREAPALRWLDVGGSDYGVALLNAGRYGHDVLGPRIRLTLVHGSSQPDAIADLGEHRVRYSLVCHPGDWRAAGVPRLAGGFNQPPVAVLGAGSGTAARRRRPPVLRGSPSVLLEGLRSTSAGQMLFRLRDSEGRTSEVDVRLGSQDRVFEADLTEEPVRELTTLRGRLRLVLRPWQVRTFLVERPGG